MLPKKFIITPEDTPGNSGTAFPGHVNHHKDGYSKSPVRSVLSGNSIRVKHFVDTRITR